MRAVSAAAIPLSGPEAADVAHAAKLLSTSEFDCELREAALLVLGEAAPLSREARLELARWFHQEPVGRLQQRSGRYVSAEELAAARAAG